MTTLSATITTQRRSRYEPLTARTSILKFEIASCSDFFSPPTPPGTDPEATSPYERYAGEVLAYV